MMLVAHGSYFLRIESMPNRLRVSVGQYSDRAPKHQNEDFYGAIIPEPPLLGSKGVAVAIADGMSGSGEGREASEFSVKGFLSDYYRPLRGPLRAHP